MYNLIVLFYFYLLGGIPYGVQSRFLPLVLRNKGVSLTSLGLYKLFHIPWLFKSFYAPVIDRHVNKRLWLFLTFSGLFSCTLILLYESENLISTDNTFMYCIPICLFLYNFWAASQDITVDSLTISILRLDQLSLGNTIQVVGYKVGAIIGGGFLSWLSGFVKISYLFMSIACLYASGMCFCLIGRFWKTLNSESSGSCKGFIEVNADGEKSKDQEGKEEKEEEEDKAYSYTKAFRIALVNSRSSRYLIGLLLIYKLGEQGAMNMLPLMLFDRGFSLSKIGFWTGVLGQLASITGSTCGHYIQKYFRSPLISILYLMTIRLCLQCPILLIAFNSVWTSMPNVSFGIGCLFMNCILFTSGAITTIMFTIMMYCTRSETSTEHQATHYTILSTAELLGKLLFSTVAAYATDICGYTLTNLGFFGLSILPVVYMNKYYRKFQFCS
ncbi:unnamed protein product [Trichobilharzia szidati]|nr:unnamed protein product [Trichobilharzia szidati]